MPLLSLIILLLSVSLSAAAPLWLKCPYEQNGDGFAVSINRLTQDICTDQGKSRAQCNRNEPWAEQQVDDGAGGNAAIVFTDVSATLRSAILDPGIGCVELTRADLDTDIARPRQNRTIFRQRRIDNADVAPIRSTVIRDLQDRTNGIRQSSLWQDLLHWLVRPALALGTFPDSVVTISTFTGDEDPLSEGGIWTSFHHDGNTKVLRKVSGEAAITLSGTGSNGSSYYNVVQCQADCDVWYNYTASGSSASAFLRMSDFGNNGDGYRVRPFEDSDVFRLYRLDNGTSFQLGADCAVTIAPPHTAGGRIEGTSLSGYLDDSLICTRTDATYSGAGYVGLGIQASADRVDNFKMTQIAAPTRRRGHVIQ